ncbi:uncharacterized protein LOC108681160 [Hyalella azteca]|uniref:Uncharacterized protein LOC108681160 n=1 Tax=Hyalella azteca TaxID=294128 RepID=A0A8B7PJJ5_HYAAZ|nr:uncharacterized protein LOC108681160 [Hyalella azteca]
MARTIVILFAVGVAASAQSNNDCVYALGKSLSLMPVKDCYAKNAGYYKTFSTKPECKNMDIYPGTYQAANCDGWIRNICLCIAKNSGLLTSAFTFDTDVFNSQVLKGKCNGNSLYQTAYNRCYAEAMQRFNFMRLVACLRYAVLQIPA